MLSGTSTLETATSGLKGSVRWQAPELLLSPEDPEVEIHSEASDIWALGMVCLVSLIYLIMGNLLNRMLGGVDEESTLLLFEV